MTSLLPARVLRARMQLMLAHPYLAAALARLPVIDASDLEWCDTMATDGYNIFVNPRWCETISEAEIIGVFAHEVLHCVLGHLDRRGSRQRVIWNVAIDYATNLLLKDFGFQLPQNGIHGTWCRGLTAEQIYDRLPKDQCDEQGFDVHLEPGDIEGLPHRQRDYPSAEERRRLRTIIQAEMSRELQRRMGKLPGEWAREFAVSGKPQVTWEQMLARFVNGLRRSDYRTYPFNKKHLWRGIYLPSIGVPGPDHLVLAIDTSGSISEQDLGRFLGELDRLRSLTECRLTLLHCDAEVQKVEEIASGESASYSGGTRRRLVGGGGTSFVPVFDWIQEKLRNGIPQPDALIYCTDGFGRFPVRSPNYPVVWIVTTGGVQAFPFGQVIRLTG